MEAIAARWQGMTDEERASVTRDAVADLNDRNEVRQEGVPESAMAAFNDTRATLAMIEREVRLLFPHDSREY